MVAIRFFTQHRNGKNIGNRWALKPIIEEDRTGNKKYKILKVTNRFDEHVADYAKDYTRIKDLALKEKQLKAIKKWMEEKIQDTYISVNAENKA